MADLTVNDIRSRVAAALAAKTPMLLLRFGDGEWIVAETDRLENEQYVNWQLPYHKHLGYLPESHHRKLLSLSLVETVRQADIIGRQHRGESQFGNSRAFVERIAPRSTLWTSADVHLDLLKSGKLFEIIGDADKVVCVTGHDAVVEALKMRCPNVGTWAHLRIPLQAKYFGAQKPGQRHYPDAWEATIKSIIHQRFDGYLALVGAGWPGKVYCSLLKQQGAVVLDIGSVFDLLAGYKTRGKGRGAGARDFTYCITKEAQK